MFFEWWQCGLLLVVFGIGLWHVQFEGSVAGYRLGWEEAIRVSAKNVLDNLEKEGIIRTYVNDEGEEQIEPVQYESVEDEEDVSESR